MRQIGTAVPQPEKVGTQISRRESSDANLPAQASYSINNLPPVMNRLTDIDIPRTALSAWLPADGRRQLRRALTHEERTALEARNAELERAIAPYGARERDRVVLALSRMFLGFTTMRRSDEEAALHLESLLDFLAPFPAWAIEKACKSIQTNGVYRDGKFDRRWAPNDSELYDAVKQHAGIYATQARMMRELLDATVEER